jgi:hypothetical protein
MHQLSERKPVEFSILKSVQMGSVKPDERLCPAHVAHPFGRCHAESSEARLSAQLIVGPLWNSSEFQFLFSETS